MAGTNPNEPAVDDGKEVTEDDLRNLKYPEDGVEPSPKEDDEPTDGAEDNEEAEATGEEGKTDDAEEDDSEEEAKPSDDEEASDFVKEFPNIKGDTPEEYAKNLEIAYKNSTAEALRLKGLSKAATPDKPAEEQDLSDPLTMWAQQELDNKITTAYTAFSAKFPQVNEPDEYEKFTNEVAILSTTIQQSQKRLASPEELYSKAAVILGWEPESTPSSKEKLAMAVKDTASTTKSPASNAKKAPKSKVTDAMIATGRKMFPGKTDQQIREELEPYVK